LPALIPNMAAGQVSLEVGARGPCYGVSSACASSAHALGDALELLRRGTVDAAVVGGTEACINPLAFACFGQMRMLSGMNDSPQTASRPFDSGRDGIVLAEGGTVLILERYQAAARRGAKIYAELAGYGRSADCYHPVRPHPEGRGAAQALSLALSDAHVAAHDVGYVNAHGTASRESDVSETLALKRVFGEAARTLWVSSTKSMTGHMLGASGAFEAMVTALTLQRGAVPPTVNLDKPDERCDLDYVPKTARERRHRVAVSNSFGFGGQNAALVFKSV
jgi:3-oxoacyl-[acyl-carrier-protein] synthase II